MTPELEKVREKYPQYRDLPDDVLADALAKKYPQYQDLPAKVKASAAPSQEQSTLGKIGQFGKRLLESSYVDPKTGQPRKESDFLGAITRPITQTAEGLYDVGKELVKTAPSSFLPPFMRPEEKPQPGDLGRRLGGIAAVTTALNPSLIPILQAANVAGEATYQATGKPMAGGAVENLAAIFGPKGAQKVGQVLTGRVAKSDAAKAAAELERADQIAAQQKNVDKAARAAEAAEAEVGAAETGVSRAQAQEAAASSRASVAEATQEFGETQVRKRAEEARRLERAGLAPSKTTPLKFGEEFAGPEFQARGEPKGYYPTAKATARSKASELYGEAVREAEKETVSSEKIAGKFSKELESQGVAAEIVPTRAETFAKRTLTVLDPLEEDQKGYQIIAQQLSQEQLEQLAKGGAMTGSMPRDAGRMLAQLFEGATDKQIEAHVRAVISAGKLPVLTGLPASDVITLRQRVNGAIRAAENSKRFDIAHQLKNYKGYLEESLPEGVLTKLRAADRNYRENFIKYFGPRAELSKIVESKNPAAIFKNIVSKDDPAQLREAMQILSPEGQSSLRGAFYHSLYNEAKGREGVDWKKLVKEYDSYSPEVKQSLLGADKAAWDTMIDNVNGFSKGAEINLKTSEEFLKAAQADTTRQVKAAEAAVKAQETAMGKRATAQTQQVKALEQLEKQQKEMKELEKLLEQQKKQGFFRSAGYVEFRKRALMIFATIDIGKWMLGIGSPNILKYGIGDLASLYVLSNPQVMEKATGLGGGAVRALSDYMSTAYADPSKLAKAATVVRLAEMLGKEDRGAKK